MRLTHSIYEQFPIKTHNPRTTRETDVWGFFTRLILLHIRIIPRHIPCLSWCTIIAFFKHPVKKLLVKKTMPLCYLLNTVIRMQNILINMIDSYLIYIFDKRYPYILLKKTTKILPVQPKLICCILQDNFFFVMMLYIITNLLQASHISCFRFRYRLRYRLCKTFYKTCHNF